MNEKDNFFSKNLRHIIYNVFHKTEANIAEELGVDDTVISRYVTGSRTPKSGKFFNKLFHSYGYYFRSFGITKDKLIKEDLTWLPDMNEYLKNMIEDKRIREVMFPIVSTEESLKVQRFKVAFESHKKIIDNPNIIDTDEELLIDTIEGYEKCLEIDECHLEAEANLVAICIMRIYDIIGYSNIKEDIDINDIKLFDIDTFIPKYYEKRKGASIGKEEKEELEGLLKDLYSSIYASIQKIRVGKYSDLAYFFLASLYLANLYNNKIREIGVHLIKKYSQIGNKYAIDLNNLWDEYANNII